MIELWISQSLPVAFPSDGGPAYFWSSREISSREKKILCRKSVKRFCLPALAPLERKQYLDGLDAFWDQLVDRFDEGHPFWRNAISSKMQEWESSACYFMGVLFTLAQRSDHGSLRLLILASSLEEEDVWRDWAHRHGWGIHVCGMSLPRWFRGWAQEFKNFFLFLKLCFKAFHAKYFSPKSPARLFRNPDRGCIFIASLFYPWSFQKAEYRDPFFGDLHRYLFKQGENCLYLGDMLSRPDAATRKSIQGCGETNVVSLYSLISWRRLWVILWRLYFQRIVIGQCLFMGSDCSALMRWNYRRCAHHFNLHAVLFFEAAKQVCQRCSIKRFLYVFEGNVFERACIQAVRQFSTAEIVGYNQGVIFESNLKLRLTSEEETRKPEPDRIICTGKHAKDLFLGVGHRSAAALTVGCALRDIPVLSHRSSAVSTKNILVALDGVYSTVSVLDWLCEHADIFVDFKVHIRAHPNVSLERIMNQSLQTIPENFIISRSTLEDDLRGSWCVLYRHTSIGIQALLNGIPVIHLAVDSPLSGDPIEKLSAGKWVAGTPGELKAAITEIYRLKDRDNSKMLKEAKEFLKDYFTSPDKEKLYEFIGV